MVLGLSSSGVVCVGFGAVVVGFGRLEYAVEVGEVEVVGCDYYGDVVKVLEYWGVVLEYWRRLIPSLD